jgi:glucuronoarabinoxylan endo-1,4-beta-xylanase
VFTDEVHPTPTPAGKKGDLNGDDEINSTDVTIMKRYILRKLSTLPVDESCADVNDDGDVNSTDLTLLKRYILRKIDKF